MKERKQRFAGALATCSAICGASLAIVAHWPELGAPLQLFFVVLLGLGILAAAVVSGLLR